jgi:hypothetical protein
LGRSTNRGHDQIGTGVVGHATVLKIVGSR